LNQAYAVSLIIRPLCTQLLSCHYLALIELIRLYAVVS